jgi:RHH-type rel operon transcriptional repressor/antitoxin RelB
MSKSTITFRADSQSKKALDEIATALDRDRSYVLNEALRSYIEAYHLQVEEIKKAVREADAGEFASPAEVKSVFSKLTQER